MLTPEGAERREKLLESLRGEEPLMTGLTQQEQDTLQDLLQRALSRRARAPRRRLRSGAGAVVLRCWCERLGWSVIIAAASLVTSVPVPIAIPMPAFFTAGASLTPSPSIATTWPCFRRTSTRRTLCSGVTWAITPRSSIPASASSSVISRTRHR
jgi:hypothetical protein